MFNNFDKTNIQNIRQKIKESKMSGKAYVLSESSGTCTPKVTKSSRQKCVRSLLK